MAQAPSFWDMLSFGTAASSASRTSSGGHADAATQQADRFSLRELGRLHDTLGRHPVISEGNRDVIVETLRAIAEVMIWGDQHEPSFFDFFLENQTLAHFKRILNQCNNRQWGGVAAQLLQTLSILTQNLRSDVAVFYLFSQNHLNDIISHRFDFGHEEVLAYYISLLKTISLKLNANTVQLFFVAGSDGRRHFPLYTEALRFFRHEESMVRAAVRTLTLQVYSVEDESVRRFVLEDPGVSGYFRSLSSFLAEQSAYLHMLVPDLHAGGIDRHLQGRVEDVLIEISDLLCYCNDILSLGVPGIAHELSERMWDSLSEPILFGPLLASLTKPLDGDADEGVEQRIAEASERTSMDRGRSDALSASPSFSRIDAALGDKASPGIDSSLMERALKDLALGSGRNGKECADGEESVRTAAVAAAVAVTVAAAAAGEEGGEASDSAADGVAPPVDSLPPTASLASSTSSHLKCCRSALLHHLRGTDVALATGVVDVLCTLAMCKNVSGSLLELAGLLPRHRRRRSRLLHELTYEADGDANYTVWSRQTEFVDALVDVLCNAKALQLPPATACQVGWLLYQVLPPKSDGSSEGPSGAVLEPSQCGRLERAYEAEREALLKELEGPWVDAIGPIVRRDWVPLRDMLLHKSTRGDNEAGIASALLLSDAAIAAGDVTFAEAVPPPARRGAAGESLTLGMTLVVRCRRVIALRQTLELLACGDVASAPPLRGHWGWGAGEYSASQLKEVVASHGAGGVAEGSEIALRDPIPCRVAFSRGAERSVFLAHAAGDDNVPASLVLVDSAGATRSSHGVCLAFAPVAGSSPNLDRAHPSWLHLRVRVPMAHVVRVPDAAKGGGSLMPVEQPAPGRGSGTGKSITDGRWTLAFVDEDSAKNALEVIEEQAAVLRALCADALDAVLSLPLAWVDGGGDDV